MILPRLLKNFHFKWVAGYSSVSKLVKSVIALFVPLLVISYFVAFLVGGRLSSPLAFNIVENYISDLGSRRFTPVPLLFDLNMFLTGILTFFIFHYSNRLLLQLTRPQINHSNRWLIKILNLAKYSLLLGPIGLIGIGIFSLDRNYYDLHFPFAVMAFLGLLIGSIAMGIVAIYVKTYLPEKIAKGMVYSPLLILGLVIIWTTGLIPPLTLKFLEWALFFAIFWWVLPVGIRFSRFLDENKPPIKPFSIKALYKPYIHNIACEI